jgi:GntR family phosphonate transport system transcriptional regulator
LLTQRTPIWEAIAASLRGDISEGLYAQDGKLPTEAVLAARFGVNRHTVRQALGALADAAIVHARRGAGVFVAMTPTDYPISRRVRFHQNLTAAGRTPVKDVLLLETRTAHASEADALHLEAGAVVHVYEGLSLVENTPVALFRSVFPAEQFPDMLAHLHHDLSVTAALAQSGVADDTRASTRVKAKLATATQAFHLRIAEHGPILRTISVNADPDGHSVKVGCPWFATDKVTLLDPSPPLRSAPEMPLP